MMAKYGMVEEHPVVRGAGRRMTHGAHRVVAVGLALLLCACSAAGGTFTPAPPAAVEAWVEVAEKQQVALSHWPAEGEARVVILGVHGFGDYGPSTFSRAAEEWAKRGIETYAYDQRGFGRNASRGDWPGADALIEDAAQMAEDIAALHPGLPLVVVGHSMGGGVALATVAEHRTPSVDGLVLLAPAIWGGDAFNPFLRMSAYFAEATFPDLRWSGRGLVSIQASDNVEMLKALGEDPYYMPYPSSTEIMGMIRVMDRAEAAAAGLDLPSLLLYGAKDEVLPERPMFKVYAHTGGETSSKIYPEGWHMLLRDLQAPNVWRDVGDFALSVADRAQ